MWFLEEWKYIAQRFYINGHSSFIHNTINLETTQMTLSKWKDKEIVVYSYNRKLINDKNNLEMNMTLDGGNIKQCGFLYCIMKYVNIWKKCVTQWSNTFQMTQKMIFQYLELLSLFLLLLFPREAKQNKTQNLL